MNESFLIHHFFLKMTIVTSDTPKKCELKAILFTLNATAFPNHVGTPKARPYTRNMNQRETSVHLYSVDRLLHRILGLLGYSLGFLFLIVFYPCIFLYLVVNADESTIVVSEYICLAIDNDTFDSTHTIEWICGFFSWYLFPFIFR